MNKLLIAFLFFIPLVSQGQLVVIDADLSMVQKINDPSKFLDRKHFVFHLEDIEVIIGGLKKYIPLMESNTRSNFAVREEIVGKSSIKVRPVSLAYGDRYELSLETKFGSDFSSLMLSDADVKNRDNVKRIRKFIKLLESVTMER